MEVEWSCAENGRQPDLHHRTDLATRRKTESSTAKNYMEEDYRAGTFRAGVE